MNNKVLKFDQFIKENNAAVLNYNKKLDLLKNVSGNWANLEEIDKLKLELALKLKYTWSHGYFDSLDRNYIDDKTSIKAKKVFQDEFMQYLDMELKELYYKYTQGKYKTLENITFEEFKNTVKSRLEQDDAFDLVNNVKFKTLSEEIVSTLFK